MSSKMNLKRRFSGDSVDEESKSDIRFNPPAFIQRYQTVQNVLLEPRFKGKLKKVADFGCSELGFCLYLKNTLGVEEVLFVDVDSDTLERYSAKMKPLHIDYLHRRTTPLVMRALEGSVNHHDKILEDVDAVVCIELIEHLYPEDLTNFPYSIFGFIKPTVAIITTPNADFNVLFKNMSGFRHWDHKFEWTRSQFEDWANNVILRFTDYEVTFHGISNGPAGTEYLGACSQMAVFHKCSDSTVPKINGTEGILKTIRVCEYPFEVDNRSDEDKILDDAIFYIRKYSMNNEDMEEEIPLEFIKNLMRIPVVISDLKDILQNNGWAIENRESGPVVMIPPPTQYSDQSLIEENFLDDIDDDYGDSDDVYGRDPGPPIEYYINRANANVYNNVDRDAENSEDWDNEPHIIIRNAEIQDSDNNGWGEIPENENENENGEMDEDNSEYANTTSSILASEINLDDLETESRLSEVADSPKDESILLSTFSEIKDLDHSEANMSSCPNVLSSTSTENHDDLPRNHFSLSQLESNAHIEDSMNGSLNVHSEDNTCITLDETLKTSETIISKNLSDSVEKCTNSPVNETQKHIRLDNIATLNENSFEEPICFSSPNDSFSHKRLKIDMKNENSHLDCSIDTSNTNGTFYSVLENNVSTDSNNLSSCSNEVSNNVPKTNELESPKNTKHTGTIPKTLKRKMLDITMDAQTNKKLDVSPDTPVSLINSSSPEVMDSGYPDSNSLPDLSPEHDLSSIAHDHTVESESPSLEDAPRIALFEVEVQNKDLDNNNLDNEGNNLEAEQDRGVDNFQPIINVLENDIENENDIYDARNGFPAWLLQIQ